MGAISEEKILATIALNILVQSAFPGLSMSAAKLDAYLRAEMISSGEIELFSKNIQPLNYPQQQKKKSTRPSSNSIPI